MRYVLIVVLSLVVVASSAHAQGRESVEFGIDAGFNVSIIDNISDNPFQVSIPAQVFRVGFFTTDKVEIEPSIALNFLTIGGTDFTALDLAVDVAHNGGTKGSPRPFIQAGVALRHVSVPGGSATQFGFGGTAGVKLPAGSLHVRLQLGVRHFLEDESSALGVTDISGTVGISFFTN